MLCFVVRTSHIGSMSVGEGEEEVEVVRMFFLVDVVASSAALL